jgi:hypothetical protein
MHRKGAIMAVVSYRVEPHDSQWSILCDGQAGMAYVSQEAAFEVAVSAASGELRKGNEVRIEVVGVAYDRAGDGSKGEPGAVAPP